MGSVVGKSLITRPVMLLILANSGLALLLSDLPTPSLVLDVYAIQRYIGTDILPPLELRHYNAVLMPADPLNGLQINSVAPPSDILSLPDAYPISYLHCTVTRARDEIDPISDDLPTTFLAEIDWKPADLKAKLVLGLNNHHVGSYYWARASGAGAAMEAPGIFLDAHNSERGILRWASPLGPTDCNSNDGKRSEWVNFLRKRDTVQLLPADAEAAVHRFANKERVYGITAKGRPLGSEPEVVCTWKLR